MIKKIISGILAAAVVFTAFPATSFVFAAESTPTNVVLITKGDTWSYRKTTSQDVNDNGYADYSKDEWTKTMDDIDEFVTDSPAPLGFSSNALDFGTVVDPPAAGLLCKKVINLSDASDYGNFKVQVDYEDGFVFYVNGVVAAYKNIRELPGGYNVVNDPYISSEEIQLSPENFKDGDNIIAVMAYNDRSGSSDIYIDLRLTADFYGSSLSDECEITSFSVAGVAGVINGDKITVTVPYGTDLSKVTPEIVASENATVFPNENIDFSNGKTQTIVVLSESGLFQKTYYVTVVYDKVPVSKVTITAKKKEVTVGSTISVSAAVSPASASVKGIKWSSSNKKIATVSNGKIKGVSPGTVKIKAVSVDDSKKYAEVTIKVIPAKPKFKKLTKKGSKVVISLSKGKGSKTTEIVIAKKGGKSTTVKTSSTSYTSKALKKGTYTVKLRAYAKVGGKVYTSGYVTKKIKI